MNGYLFHPPCLVLDENYDRLSQAKCIEKGIYAPNRSLVIVLDMMS